MFYQKMREGDIPRFSMAIVPQFYFRTTDVTGAVDLPKRCRNGDAGRQCDGRSEIDCADSDGRRVAVCGT